MPGECSRSPQQLKDREAIRTGHLYVGQQKVVFLFVQTIHQLPDIRAAVTVNLTAGKHSTDDSQLDTVVINDQHTDINGQFTNRRKLLFRTDGVSGR